MKSGDRKGAERSTTIQSPYAWRTCIHYGLFPLPECTKEKRAGLDGAHLVIEKRCFLNLRRGVYCGVRTIRCRVNRLIGLLLPLAKQFLLPANWSAFAFA